MKLASFIASDNPTYGVVTNDGVIDVGRRLKSRYPSLRTALSASGLQDIATEAKAAKPDFSLDHVNWLPPIPDPGKIICIGLNYKAHAAEAGLKVPEKPSLFVRFSNRPIWVKHFQAIHHCSVDVTRGLVLLFGIGTKALPPWESKTRWNNLYRGLAVNWTAGPSGHTNSPHPSSRKGHHSTAGWSSSVLLS